MSQLLDLFRSATAASRDAYRQLMAALVLGESRDEPVHELRKVLGRALVLAGLLAHRRAAAAAPVKPEAFAKPQTIRELLVVEAMPEAVAAFAERTAMTAAAVRELVARSDRLAAAIVSDELQTALPALLAKSRAVQEAIKRAFWASDVSQGTVVNLKDLIARAISGGVSAVTDSRGRLQLEGVNLPEFISRANLAGAQHLTDLRLETIYRNNLGGAFNEGLLDAVTATPGLALLMLTNPRDRRSRGNPDGLYPEPGRHFQMHGYVNTPEAFTDQGIVPPAGHLCRCSFRPLTAREAIRLGVMDEDRNLIPAALAAYNGERQAIIDRGEYPDRGWVARPLAA